MRRLAVEAAVREIGFEHFLRNNELSRGPLCGAGRLVAAEDLCVGNVLAPQTAKALNADAFTDMIGEADAGVAPDAPDYRG